MQELVLGLGLPPESTRETHTSTAEAALRQDAIPVTEEAIEALRDLVQGERGAVGRNERSGSKLEYRHSNRRKKRRKSRNRKMLEEKTYTVAETQTESPPTASALAAQLPVRTYAEAAVQATIAGIPETRETGVAVERICECRIVSKKTKRRN